MVTGVVMAADTEKLWNIREDGCLSVDASTSQITYNSSLNAVILLSKDHVTVIDALSGAFLQKSDLSGNKSGALKCVYLPERDKTLFCDGCCLGIRGDLQGILLLDTALQTPAHKTEDVVKIELPLVEATQLLKTLLATDLSSKEYVDDFARDLSQGIQRAQDATQGNHKTAKWATVCLQMQHMVLKSVCSALMEELTKTNQTGQGFPVASAVVDRLGFLLPRSRLDITKEPVNRALMYSEAARRETFANWPHMNYKWALPEPMAQAGFFHHPNIPGDGEDRAMCFTCNVCLVCWEPTDEPWSEHERHSQLCPYIKGEYTQNVPLTVTYATQPAHFHGHSPQQKIACISTTFNEDFVATSTRDGNLVVWDVSHILKKHCQFDIDLNNALVAMKTGLQIERSGAHGKRSFDRKKNDGPEAACDGHPLEIALHDHKQGNDKHLLPSGSRRPSDDLYVTSLCVAEEGKWREEAGRAASPVKSSAPVGEAQLSVLCGVMLRQTKAPQSGPPHGSVEAGGGSGSAGGVLDVAGPGEGNLTVQLMNEVNEAVSSDVSTVSSRIITDQCQSGHNGGNNSGGDLGGLGGNSSSEFVMPESRLVPYVVVVSLVDDDDDDAAATTSTTPGQTSPSKKKKPLPMAATTSSSNSSSSSSSSSSTSSTVKASSSMKPGVGMLQPAVFANSTDDWLLHPWEDPDCQIIGFSPPPPPSHKSSGEPSYGAMETGEEGSSSQPPSVVQDLSNKSGLANGPSTLCDMVDSLMAEPMPEPTSPLHSFTFSSLVPVSSSSSSSAKPFFFANAGESGHTTATSSGSNSGGCPQKEAPKIGGTVVQCLELPGQFQQEHIEVCSILPSSDKQHVIVVLSTKIGYLESSASSCSSSPSSSSPAEEVPPVTNTPQAEESSCRGGVVVYSVKCENGHVVLDVEPVAVHTVVSPQDVITATFLLPMEVEDQVEEQLGRPDTVDNQGVERPPSVPGHLVVTTAAGLVRVLSLHSLTSVAELTPGPGEKFLSVTYCSGIERLCVCTDSGKIQFFDLETVSDRRSSLSSLDQGDGSETGAEGSACKRAKIEDDLSDHSGSEYLSSQTLTSESLLQLHELVQFENLMPRFTAVVPPCWSEIQQEQQQRRHPQHLTQQGEATQHTRTWKLTADAGQTWDEHLLEILLPKPCPVGHVDLKFSLHQLCTTQPNIEVTLLKQNIGSMHRPASANSSTSSGRAARRPTAGPESTSTSHHPQGSRSSSSSWVAGGVDSLSSTSSSPSEGGSCEEEEAQPMVNNVLDPAFLEAHNAEILCGPVRLSNCLDLSGLGGLVTLSSPQLLSSKPRSLLLHIKGFEDSPQPETAAVGGAAAAGGRDKSEAGEAGFSDKMDRFEQHLMKMFQMKKKKSLGAMYKNLLVDKNIKGLFNSVVPSSSQVAKAQPSRAEERQKLADVKGCDWFQELSVTVRVFKKSSLRNEKAQRSAMIQDSAFHRRLLKVVVSSSCVNDTGVLSCVSGEHLQNMALDVLIWMLAVQMNDADRKGMERMLLQSMEEELKGLVRACYIVGSRSTAHKFSRLMALCMECSKLSPDPDLAPAFNHSLLQALLDSFPLLPACASSGALRWFFSLLNRVKCMDADLVARRCDQLVQAVAQQYHQRGLPQQALLKTRYGLYGNPFEAELFDMELSGITKPGAAAAHNTAASSSGATPTSIFSNVMKPVGALGGSGLAAGVSKDQPDLFDMLTAAPEKTVKSQPDCLRSDILGLLEVEPLHFRCHATSDGTRMERMDASSSSSSSANSALLAGPATNPFSSGPAQINPFLPPAALQDADGQPSAPPSMALAASHEASNSVVRFCEKCEITTVGRCSGGTTRSRIPLGSFYGHTYILPWEWPRPGPASGTVGGSDTGGAGPSSSSADDKNSIKNSSNSELSSHSSLLSQLGLFLSLLEDLQCRFSLARSRLESLLTVVSSAQYLASHVHYHLKKTGGAGKLSDEDAQLIHCDGLFILCDGLFILCDGLFILCDGVFILLSALGQKSLAGPSALSILDSLLAMLSSVLQPLMDGGMSTAYLDLSLLSWVLLFLCRNMDMPNGTNSAPDDADKGTKKDKEACSGLTNRWSFMESQWSPAVKGWGRGKESTHRLRGFHRRIQQSKQKFRLLCGSNKSQLSTKGEKEDGEGDSEQPLVLARARCLAVVRGLVALLLSMDFTCHVDLFLVACKVLSKMCVACRPSISLWEAMSQEQLERLVLLVVDTEFNHDHLRWGGPWAGHAITCLLQDILDGEGGWRVALGGPYFFYSSALLCCFCGWLAGGAGRDLPRLLQDFHVVVLFLSVCLSICLSVQSADLMEGKLCLHHRDSPASLVTFFANKSEKERWNNFLEVVGKHQTRALDSATSATTTSASAAPPSPPPAPAELPDFIMEVSQDPDLSSFEQLELMDEVPGPAATGVVDALKISTSQGVLGSSHLKKLFLKNKMPEHLVSMGGSGLSHSLSTALDARLELGLETLPEHRLKVMQSMHMGNIQSAFSSPLPPPPAGYMSVDDSRSSDFDVDVEGTSLPDPGPSRATADVAGGSSLEMLTQCFERMFARLSTGRVSLESVLQLWLTLNEDSSAAEAAASSVGVPAGPTSSTVFDPTRQPMIGLSENAVASLMEVGVLMPCMVVRTWVYLLQALCLLTNQRRPGTQGAEGSLATCVLNNANLAPLLTKLLSSHAPTGSPASLSQHYQMGPAAVKMFGDLLYRLQCKSIEVGGQRFKEMLLKIVYDLTAERGAIYQSTGPLDAQVQFVEMLCDSPVLAVDVSNALSVVQTVTSLVYQHLAHQDQVACRSSHDTSTGARTCFGGLVASLLRGSESRAGSSDSLRDNLMFLLLQLVNKMISAPVTSHPSRPGATTAGRPTYQDVSESPRESPRKTVWADNSLETGSRLSPRLLTSVRLSDDEKSSRTRGGQGHTGAAAVTSSTASSSSQHGMMMMMMSGGEEEEEEEDEEMVSSEMADIVVGNPVIMQNLIRSLSHCHSNKLALMFTHSSDWPPLGLHKTVDQTEPLTAGDLVFTVLRTLKDRCSDRNVMVDSLFKFFTGHPPVTRQPALTRLSEPLLFFTLRSLSSQAAINKFIELNGVEVVGSNLVRCSQQMISASPSIISTLMQNFSSIHTDLGDKSKGFDPDDTEGLQSFAHLGTITCSSPTASPADGLIQFGANRRARSATWAYHFYPDEPYVELTVHLPFAVLLKYVHIRPHGSAIANYISLLCFCLSCFVSVYLIVFLKSTPFVCPPHPGTITCSSPTASPADGLIQFGANRRARSATWAYHFYPDEPYVELTVHLPFAVLLKYVHIRPHGSAIATCPSQVSLELSHDGTTVWPASPPLVTSSLSLIRLQLQKPAVVTSVTLILHRPLDSMTIGLQKISLCGQTAFAESSENTPALLNEDCFSHSSLGWMQILHHCLVTSGEESQSAVALTAAAIPHLVATCTSLLGHPYIGVHAHKLERVLLVLGLSHRHIGLALLDNVLRPPAGLARANGDFHSYLGKIHGSASPYTVEILYRLGTAQDENTHVRVEALLRWLEDCANACLTSRAHATPSTSAGRPFGGAATSMTSGGMFQNALLCPSPEHVQCVAAVLWHSVELPVSYPLHTLLTTRLIRSLYEWSRLLPEGNLRKSVNHVLCSACHVCPSGFMHVQEWMGVVRGDGSQLPREWMSVVGGEQEWRMGVVASGLPPAEVMSPGRMTDDSKAGSPHHPLYSQDGMTDDSKEAFRLHSLSSMSLDESKLMLLAAVCKSPVAIRQLMSCGLPAMLAQAVCEFCNQQMVLAISAGPLGAAGSENGPKRFSDDTGETDPVTAPLVSSILRFFTEISSELELKDWLGRAEGNAFWSQLLTLLCGSQFQPPALIAVSQSADRASLLSAEDRSELETRTIQFFSAVIAFHAENQLLFARVLCDVIKDQGTSKSELLSAMPLSGFMRRLLLQVLLEDEKISVSVRNASSSVPPTPSTAAAGQSEESSSAPAPHHTDGPRSFPLTSCNGQIFHPRYGSGRSCQCITMNLNAKCSDVIVKVADTLPLASIWSEKREDKKKRGEEGASIKKKEVLGELDPDVMDFVTQSGAAAKEKREKSSALKSGLPPRPPTRRGRAGTGADSGLEAIAGLRPQAVLLRGRLRHIALPGKDLPHNLTLSQLLHVLSDQGHLPPALALQFVVRLKNSSSPTIKDHIDGILAEEMLASPPLPSALKVFASVGGLALLAEHLPLLFPEICQQSSGTELVTDGPSVTEAGPDMATGDSSDEVYETFLEPITPPHTSKSSKHPSARLIPSIPPHSLIAFGLFLRLPGYAEVLLKERKMAQCLLRLVLGVTDDGDGGQILTCQLASSLATMPMTVLKTLFDSCPLTTDDGVLLRRMALDIGVVHLVLACLARLSHHQPRAPLTSFQHQVQLILSAMQSPSAMASLSQPEEKSQQHYWAKGTGFGTGSTTSSWDAEQAMLKQKGEEEHVACLLQVLASYVNPNLGTSLKPGCITPSEDEEEEENEDQDARSTASSPVSLGASSSQSGSEVKSVIPSSLRELLSQSCLVPALSSYLRNDSVLDMARHVPLYRALLQLLRGIALTPCLVPILLPMEEAGCAGGSSSDPQSSIEKLLEKMKGCVDTYASRLKSNKGKSGNKMEDEESEGLALLIPDIQETARLVHLATQRVKDLASSDEQGSSEKGAAEGGKPVRTLEEQYMCVMKELQFDTYEMVREEGRSLKFAVSHHYESNVKAAGTVNNVARTRRLAQEAVTLSTSLPLAFSSSVYVRCDEDRLDVMKVLITGPSETPYANGCFEFDVFFPQDYPNTPPFINMETTGNHSVRFNPNLYNDGKVCLSILNTWHGRPEEKWNPQTSSFLQVLVSIQSLILVSEPYFNEPGYERSRGTPPGEASSHEYDANIRQATVKWAMLEQLKNPSPCFKEIIHTHFWLKRHEILQQCEAWIAEMDSYNSDKRTVRSIAQSTLALKLHYNQLREELSKLKPPPDLELDSEPSQMEAEARPYSTSSQPGHTAPAVTTATGTAAAAGGDGGSGEDQWGENSSSSLLLSSLGDVKKVDLSEGDDLFLDGGGSAGAGGSGHTSVPGAGVDSSSVGLELMSSVLQDELTQTLFDMDSHQPWV
ncbi:baculoviral IAP repeat-containing protein 6 [Aplysia californica]|uniref:Baculoviral IAP repeat-containing protein 6 n=1 Tax=Aplysia californica TaxID=6500 RepID=A0ABM1VSU3_APLCA|nr:baculoviral IAP repeat-containing protein 6 [Aplysia californica]